MVQTVFRILVVAFLFTSTSLLAACSKKEEASDKRQWSDEAYNKTMTSAKLPSVDDHKTVSYFLRENNGEPGACVFLVTSTEKVTAVDSEKIEISFERTAKPEQTNPSSCPSSPSEFQSSGTQQTDIAKFQLEHQEKVRRHLNPDEHLKGYSGEMAHASVLETSEVTYLGTNAQHIRLLVRGADGRAYVRTTYISLSSIFLGILDTKLISAKTAAVVDREFVTGYALKTPEHHHP